MEFKIWETIDNAPETLTEDEINLYGMVNRYYGRCKMVNRYYGRCEDNNEFRQTGWFEIPEEAYMEKISDYQSDIASGKSPEQAMKYDNLVYRGLLSGALDVFDNAKEGGKIDELLQLTEKVMKDRGADKLEIYDITYHGRLIGTIGSEELFALRDNYEEKKAEIESWMDEAVLFKGDFVEPEYVTKMRSSYDEELGYADVLEKLDKIGRMDEFKDYLSEWEQDSVAFWDIEHVQYFTWEFWHKHAIDILSKDKNAEICKSWRHEMERYEHRKEIDKPQQPQIEEKALNVADISQQMASISLHTARLSGAIAMAVLNGNIKDEVARELLAEVKAIDDISSLWADDAKTPSVDKAGKEDKTTETAEKQENSANVFTLYRMMNRGNSM